MPVLDPILRCYWAPETRPASQGEEDFDDTLQMRVESWEYIDKSSGADEGKLVIDNGDLSLLDDERLAIGARVRVEWGWPHEMHPARRITIRKRQGFKKLTLQGPVVEAESFLGQQVSWTWENATPWEAAEDLARSMGFTDARSRDIRPGDAAQVRRTIAQTGETNWAFLMRLAAENGQVCYVTGDVFHFHAPDLGQAPNRTVTYWDSDTGDFTDDPTFEIATLGRPGRVRRVGHSERERGRVEGTAGNNDDPGRPVLGDEIDIPDPETGALRTARVPQEDRAATTAESNEEAQSQARQTFRAGERETVKGTFPLIGMPWLQADTVVTVEGVGQKLSGNYHMKQVTHSVSDSGYTTKAEGQRNATSRSGGRGTRAQRGQGEDTNDANGRANTGGPSANEVEAIDVPDPETGELVTRYRRRGDRG